MPRSTVTAGMVAAADKFTHRALRRGWGVRVGTEQYPDYALGQVGGYKGGRMLSPDEAEAYGESLIKAASWARAQNRLDELA